MFFLGKMYPKKADLYFALFSDESLFHEQLNRCSFWTNSSFFGVNMSHLKNAAFTEVFTQPVVVNFNLYKNNPLKYPNDFGSFWLPI